MLPPFSMNNLNMPTTTSAHGSKGANLRHAGLGMPFARVLRLSTI